MEIPVDAESIKLFLDAHSGDRGEDQQRIAAFGVQLIATLLKKNADYGGSAWDRPVLAPDCDPGKAIRVRMSDKIARLERLLAGNESQIDSESIEDTLADLAGYIILDLARPKDGGK